MSKTNHTGPFIGGMVVGTAVGTVIGLLIAPRPGRETRQILKKSAQAMPELVEDLATTLQLHADHLSASALSNWEETLARLKEAIAAGIEASEQEVKELESPRELTAPAPTSEHHL